MRNFESCRSETFQKLNAEIVLSRSIKATADLAPAGNYHLIDPVDVEVVSRLFSQHSLVVCVLEGLPLSALFDVN